jgi:hypothetical protein
LTDETPYDAMLLALCQAIKARADAYMHQLEEHLGHTEALGAHAAAVRDLGQAYEHVRRRPHPPEAALSS